jgi:HAD superfamily hydrolase (TIGR01450 family)
VPEISPARLIGGCRGFLVDLDGTTYIDDQLCPGAADFLAELDRRGYPRLFLSNNSSRSGDVYVERLAGLGIAVQRSQVLTSGDATIEYLRRRTDHRSVCLIATPELEADFRAAGFDLDAADPDCVVAAFDTTLTFAKLERACTELFAGKPYYATHPDKTCITGRGLIPDIAAIIAACEAVTGRTPKIIGKPAREIVDVALELLGTTAAETAIVGDQLDTDMQMGRSHGLVSALVMSGETSSDRLAACPPERRPDIVAAHVGEVLELLRR